MIKEPNYTQIPNEYLDNIMPTLTGTENVIFIVIMRKTFGWHKKKDTISYSQIRGCSGISSNTTIQNALRTLQEKGLISVIKGVKGITYEVNITETVNIENDDLYRNCKDAITETVKIDNKMFTETVNTKEKGLNKDLKKGKNEDQFLIFYQSYPKKTNKTDARKTFNKLIKSGVSLDSILSKLTIYKKQIEKDQTDIKYIKNPQRFLNCLDDYETEEEKKPVSEKRICPACGSTLSGLFCKTCFTQYNEKMEATF